MYFTKFNPVFPIVHAPTFRPSTKSSLLLLSICSVGSLFIGSPRAASQGQRIFEMLNKSILASVSEQCPEFLVSLLLANRRLTILVGAIYRPGWKRGYFDGTSRLNWSNFWSFIRGEKDTFDIYKR